MSTERDVSESADLRSLARFPDENPHPIFRVTRDDVTLLYANAPSAPILQVWNTEIGGSVPADVQTRVLEGIAKNEAVEIEVDAEDATYVLSFLPIPNAPYVNVYGRDVTSQRLAEARERDRTLSTRDQGWDGVVTLVTK